jgi:tRNA modification GTPase
VDRIEQLGIEVSERYLASAEVVLACAENAQGLDQTVRLVRDRTKATIQPVLTKADLVTNGDERPPGALAVSTETGEGLQRLLSRVAAIIDEQYGPRSPEMPLLTRARHKEAIDRARAEIAQFHDAWTAGKLPATVAAVHLHTAINALEELVGVVDVEDILDRVFSSFCVGK